MLHMIARRRGMYDVTVGTDTVIGGITLPSDTVVRDVRATFDILDSGAGFLAKNVGIMYGIEGYILPLLDPDSAIEFNVLWDNLVPKDTDTETIDLDTGAADTTPFFEPGEIDWSKVLDVGLRPRKIYSRYKLMTFNNAAQHGQDEETPFAAQWVGGDRVHVRIRRSLHVSQPSVLLFAFASPAVDDTTTTPETALTEPNLSQVKYMEETLERAHLTLIGLTEAGAETPFVEAGALIKTHLEPDMFEQTSGRYFPVAYRVFTEMMIGHSVRGRFGTTTLSTGR